MENQAFSGGVSTILRSGLILENIFFFKFMDIVLDIVLVAQIGTENILQMFLRIDQISK